MSDGWIGVDLDGTLAHHNGMGHTTSIGEPIPVMLERVKSWLNADIEVRIVTARAGINPQPTALSDIEAWCLKHVGRVLPVTASKDYQMIELWDDRAIRVERNTGKIV